MATQSLYRRYRPRRFGELRGQEHIVRALRNAVVNEREGQAYLFSGPRGTGKTTSARILAKVLNCERTVDGEPCCECDSCLAVERGTSYDVHELDAASNNGVEAMRDLIEKASLGTPGRHKVYILDEVHMLSKAAEAALLKTLEEPPPHVVFVLATTDPQKVSDTIRSRTQHLRFHLLPMDELEAHVRWVAQDAGLEVSDAAIQSVLEQGGGSARDTLSALELVASAGGDDVEAVQYGEFVEALIEHDPGRALTAAAFAVQQGRDPRALTEDIVRHLRDCFLSLMAPELVSLPDQKAASVAEQAARLGAVRTVRAMERLGEMLVEMRHAPDPRLLLEVALVQLTHEAAANDIHTLMIRLERLEQAVEHGGFGPGAAAGASAAPTAPVTPPVVPRLDPSTGRAVLGGGARRPDPASTAPTTPTATTPTTPTATTATTPTATTPNATTPKAATSPPAASPPATTSALTTSTARPAVPSAALSSGSPASARESASSGSRASGPAAPDRTGPPSGESARPAASAPVARERPRPGGSSGPDDPVAPAAGSRPVDAREGAARRGAAGRGAASTPAPAAGPAAQDDTSFRDANAGGTSAARDTGSADPSDARRDAPVADASAAAGQDATSAAARAERAASIWAAEIVPGLKPLTRALFSVPKLLGVRDGVLTLAVPNDPHRRRCDQQIPEVEAAAAAAAGGPVTVRVIVDGSAAFDDVDEHPSMSGPPASGSRMAPVVELRPGGLPTPDEEIDLDDLVDVPPEHVVTPIDRLTQAFPGSQLIDERH